MPGRKTSATPTVLFDDETEDDRPEDVLDVGQGDMVRPAVVAQKLFGDLAGVADGHEEEDAGQGPGDPPAHAERPDGNDDCFAHGVVLTRGCAARSAASRARPRPARR